MVGVCFYFQVHQPFRAARYKVFDIGNNEDYFDEEKNRDVMLKVARKSYLPMNKVLMDNIKDNPEFKVSFSISGCALEQFEKYAPEVIDSFQELSESGNVEFLNETYHHSLSFLYSRKEFVEQVYLHRKAIKRLFNQRPKVFRNTELIYYNPIARCVKDLGYDAILAEGWDKILGWRSPNFLYKAKGSDIRLLLKNYKLSDDIAFRFGNKSWNEHPLTADKFARWISSINGSGDIINLFMDYETFGEHQWEDTGIFDFMRVLPKEIKKDRDNSFIFPSEAVRRYPLRDEVDVADPVSWADTERDISAWLGNRMQKAAAERLYKLEEGVKRCGDNRILDDWRKLTTSDHFYYMCTKWFSDGDVHKYFNPYNSPYDAFIAFMNILSDMEKRIKEVIVDGPILS